MTPAVSVVIPVYNGAATIGDTLRSLLAQAAAPAFEVIVVDNGSTDGTPTVVRGFDVTLLEETIRGPGAARDRGLRHARGEIVAHCDADTVPTRRWLAEIVAPLREADVAIVGGQNLTYRPATGAERFAAASHIWDSERSAKRASFPFVSALNMAVRRADALAGGGWDATLLTGEDIDFSHRVQRLRSGTRIAYAPKAVLFHRNRATDEELRRQAHSYGRGLAQLYLRHPHVAPWTPRLSLSLGLCSAVRIAAPAALAVLARIGLASNERLEFARYHRMWHVAHTIGFVDEFRTGLRQPPQRCSCG